MRIVAGEWRGRRLVAPPGRATRPTADRVREAWMSIVGAALVDARVLDLFGGSGALALEALSRGAAHADVVEQDARALRTLRTNAEALGAGDRLTVHRAEVLRFLRDAPPDGWDVAFADPPYRQGLAAQVAASWLARPFAAVLGVEHEAGALLPGSPDTRRYGDTALSFYRT